LSKLHTQAAGRLIMHIPYVSACAAAKWTL